MRTVKDSIDLLKHRTRKDRPWGEPVANHPNDLEEDIIAVLTELERRDKANEILTQSEIKAEQDLLGALNEIERFQHALRILHHWIKINPSETPWRPSPFTEMSISEYIEHELMNDYKDTLKPNVQSDIIEIVDEFNTDPELLMKLAQEGAEDRALQYGVKLLSVARANKPTVQEGNVMKHFFEMTFEDFND